MHLSFNWVKYAKLETFLPVSPQFQALDFQINLNPSMALTTLSVVISFSLRLIKRAHRSLFLVSVTKSILRTILMSKKTKLLFMSSSVTACRVCNIVGVFYQWSCCWKGLTRCAGILFSAVLARVTFIFAWYETEKNFWFFMCFIGLLCTGSC